MERAVAHLNKKVCRVGGIWRPINIDVVRPFLVPKERDGIVARFADWERERQRLLEALKQKEGMVAMLSSRTLV